MGITMCDFDKWAIKVDPETNNIDGKEHVIWIVPA